MNPFNYHKPTDVSEAVTLLAQADATVLAGGMTLLPTIKQQLATPSALVDLSGIESLSGISADGDNIVIGAMVTHAEVAASAMVREKIPVLAALAGGIGDAQVRHRGTIGGSLANNDPAADYPAAALALGATVFTNKRKIAANEYFQGLFTTVLEDGEIIQSVSFPIPSVAAYLKFRQQASLYALVGVFVAKQGDGVRVAVTGAGADGVFRAGTLEEVLNNNFSAAALDGVDVSADALMSDIHGSADYRASLIVTLAKRAIAQMI